MKTLSLDRPAREALWSELEAMPEHLSQELGRLSPEQAARPGPDGAFSPVEQCWHLADLEREGFGVRIQRLLAEVEPHLPDFDGAAIARERRYGTKSLADGLDAFRKARRQNLRTLHSVPAEAWTRRGTQEGVGPVQLCDLPVLMAQHDAAHRQEIEAWRQANTV